MFTELKNVSTKNIKTQNCMNSSFHTKYIVYSVTLLHRIYTH